MIVAGSLTLSPSTARQFGQRWSVLGAAATFVAKWMGSFLAEVRMAASSSVRWTASSMHPPARAYLGPAQFSEGSSGRFISFEVIDGAVFVVDVSVREGIANLCAILRQSLDQRQSAAPIVYAAVDQRIPLPPDVDADGVTVSFAKDFITIKAPRLAARPPVMSGLQD